MPWQAVLSDGSIVNEVNAQGQYSSYSALNQTQLKEFRYVLRGKLRVALPVPPDAKVVYRRRVEQPMVGTSKQELTAWYLVGWRRRNGETMEQVLCWVRPDGSVEVTTQFVEDGWRYSPVFMSHEQV